ncbi:hypothetical protein HHK36_005430 [Tetracentron sinense]|uniref:F-box domain-containing protein n=1 Tax=Tetracentron sinense TaxID=13715 RepID=A0A834ZKZ9_TETSI|nr:hypothetical protein HHK36_005430 [Tetracentron sinense]
MNESMVEYDRIMELPEPILHHILSFIPTRDVIRTSVLSKRWRFVWNSFPILDFDCHNFYGTYSPLPSSQIIEHFMNIIDKSLRCREPNTIIDKFRLVLDEFEVEFTHRVNKWIEFVVESNVKELDLNICTDYNNEERIYGLPLSLFDAKSMSVLRLEGFKLVPSGVTRFSSLRSLSLIGMYIDDQIIRDHILSCPLIENLILQSCFGLGHLQVSSPQIKTLEVVWCSGLKSIEIDTQSLQSFLYKGGRTISCEINAAGLSYLKTISLEGVKMMEKFQRQISQCPLLESLKLVECDYFGSLKICNQHLKSLVLDSCYGRLEAEIEAQNLLSFMYGGTIYPFALTMNTSSLLDATLKLYPIPHSLWLSKLRDFLGRFDHVKVLTLVNSQCMIIPKELRESLLPPLYHLKHLKAEIEPPVRHLSFPRLEFPEQISKEYFEGLLWLSPRLKTLDLVFLNRTLKFHYKKLRHSNSYKSIPIGSWKQCLKKVKIENFEGTNDDFCILKFLLENAKALEKIQCISNLQILPENYMELNGIRIASPHAKIVPGVMAGKAAGMEVVAVPSLPKQAHLYTSADDHIYIPEKWGLPPFHDCPCLGMTFAYGSLTKDPDPKPTYLFPPTIPGSDVAESEEAVVSGETGSVSYISNSNCNTTLSKAKIHKRKRERPLVIISSKELCNEEEQYYSKRRMNESMVEYDRITELPEPILHHILSFIPTRDVIRTSVLSKRWRCVWNSFPILDFDCHNFLSAYSSLPSSQIIENFMNIIDKSLRRREPNISIEKFRLVLNEFEIEFTPRVNKWIEFAIESNVKELNLNIRNNYGKERMYGLSLSLFAAESVMVLRLDGFQLVPSGVSRFSSLRSLSLIVMYIDDQIIRDLIFRCPLIEILILKYCHGLEYLQVSSPQIKTLEVVWCSGLKSIEINTHSLQSFLYKGGTISCEINAAGFSYLKTISLEGVKMTEKFQRQISQCPLLESLKLVECNYFGSLNICNQHLKSLVLDSCYGLLEAEIEAQNLLSFMYAGYIFPLALMNTSSLLDATLNLSCNPHDPLWFNKLRDFLGRFDHVKVLTLVNSQSMIIPKEQRESLLAPLYDLKHLKADIEPTSVEYAEYLDGFLWCCPRLETVDLVSINKTLKFHYKKPRHSNSCKSFHIRSWQQCLKKVKIENFEGTDDDLCILKFLLENAKALEMIECISNLQMLQGNHMELSGIRIASPHAKIVFC